jgi:Putative transposase
LAWRHDLCTAVAGVLHRAVHRHLRSWARTRGLADARSGAVIIVQRFGGALNLNVHFHALVVDGVFARAADGRLRFHRAPAPMANDVADVLAAIVPGVRARLAQEGVEEDAAGGDRFAEAPLLARLAAASVEGTLAMGGVPGRRPERLGEAGGPRAGSGRDAPHARWEGFDLHADVAVPAGHRARLEAVPILTTPADLRGVFPSPDRRWLAYVENNFTLKKISVTGGTSVSVSQMDGPSRGAAWGPNDTIVFATAAADTGLQQVGRRRRTGDRFDEAGSPTR